jgi:hypothetical protein
MSRHLYNQNSEVSLCPLADPVVHTNVQTATSGIAFR